ncbi:hypothetical protein [Saccharomonospora cyanea]|uniref:Uncharacterized protein n=1 Tax=Saccharomonospora cyanea NA-134 TaxID=882082 RepID=H5XFG4_9PSEU|nr:hypothetical protein [Saccharomonospora cyanea]EHR62587.1 hypothetical protein SaccyDRAFT_3760 [Saccharomonospora cyanea NA-134]
MRGCSSIGGGPLDGPKRAEWAYDTAEWGIGRLASSTRYVDGEAYVRKTSIYDPLYSR